MRRPPRSPHDPFPHPKGEAALPTLYTCRTSLSEAAAHFAAAPPRPTDWSPELWPGRTGLIVRETDEGRVIETMTWGLPSPLGIAGKPRIGFWWREIARSESDLLKPARRCLLIVDSFALPGGPEGARTKTWYGFDQRPIFGWGGFWRDSGRARGYAGLLIAATDPVSPGNAMPAIIDPARYSAWLSGSAAEGGPTIGAPQPGLYREETEQPWGADRTP